MALVGSICICRTKIFIVNEFDQSKKKAWYFVPYATDVPEKVSKRIKFCFKVTSFKNYVVDLRLLVHCSSPCFMYLLCKEMR